MRHLALTIMLVRCSLHRFINSSIPRRVFFYSTCVNCSSPINSNIPVCKSCGSISPLPSHLSHHSLLGIPDKPNPFLIHLPTLKQKFRQAQSICHPDAWSTKPPVCILCYVSCNNTTHLRIEPAGYGTHTLVAS